MGKGSFVYSVQKTDKYSNTSASQKGDGWLINIILIITVSYLAGSFPSSYLTGKLLKSIDIRDYGSGNPGAANTFRILGKKAGILVLSADFLKGFITLTVVGRFFNPFPDNSAIIMTASGIAVITGHVFPVWLKFRGGKGVATSAGVFTALYPPLFPASLMIFVISVLIIRKISAASLITALTLPAVYRLMNLLLDTISDPYISVLTLSVPILIIIRHRSNIIRIIKRTEPDINEESERL